MAGILLVRCKTQDFRPSLVFNANGFAQAMLIAITCFSIQFSILYSLKTPDHWYMRNNIIIYKLQWFTGEGHKKEKQNTTNAKRGGKNTKYMQMS